MKRDSFFPYMCSPEVIAHIFNARILLTLVLKRHNKNTLAFLQTTHNENLTGCTLKDFLFSRVD